MREWREARGVSPRDVAARLGVTKGAISQWETSGAPTLRNFFAYCDAIGVPVQILISYEPSTLEGSLFPPASSQTSANNAAP